MAAIVNAVGWYLLRTFAPVAAEAFLALVRSLEQQGADPGAATARAATIIAGVERDHPDWAEGTRRAYALERIRAELRRSTGREPDGADVHGLYGLALQQLRSPAGQAPAATRR